ncbi:MAG: glycosyltransferase family 4 protein [Deltaproteobacteria bacterium]|nr:glycosyltransferase family 4 protein [Deltaproteobacteria bacterium]
MIRTSETLKICYVVSTFYPTPGATTPYEISSHVASRGHDVFVVAPRLKGQRRLEEVNNVVVYRVNVPGRPVRFSNIVLALKALMIVLRKSPDIVHVTFSPQQFLLPLLGKLLFKLKKPKWIFHMISVSVDKNPMRRFLQNKKSKFESRFFDAVVTSNKYIKERMLGRNWRRPVYLVPIGVNCTRFANPDPCDIEELRNKWGIKSNQCILIYVGTLSGRNLSILINAFKRVTEHHEGVRLFLVGEGEEKEKLHRLAERLNISNQVVFTGYLAYQLVPAFLKLAQIAISPIPKNDIYDIQPPLKTLEYISSGLPTVATDTLANRIFIKDGINGILVSDDEESIFNGMDRLLSDEKLRSSLSSNAKISAGSFDWDVSVGNSLEPAYRDILRR